MHFALKYSVYYLMEIYYKEKHASKFQLLRVCMCINTWKSIVFERTVMTMLNTKNLLQVKSNATHVIVALQFCKRHKMMTMTLQK